MSGPIWLTEANVSDLLTMGDAIAALEVALRSEALGEALNMPKTMLQFGKSNLHALGANIGDYVGTKTWAHTAGGTSPLLLIWRADDGQLVAVIEAFALGNLRTGGISGVATNCMAKADATTLAIIGTGKQSLSQAAAVVTVRKIKQIRVYSPKQASRQHFIDDAHAQLGNFEMVDCATPQQACDAADIVTLVTRAATPFLTADMLQAGTHLNAVGAIGPDREEFAQDVFDRAGSIAVDNLTSVQSLSREFSTRFGDTDWSAVRALSSLVQGGATRQPEEDLTLFKAMGMGISDLALGVELLRRAQAAHIGRAIEPPHKVKPRLKVAYNLD